MNVTKQLYQWDTGQKLTECTGIYVDYLIGDEVYRVEITDGTCIIPDELLQTSGRYKVWECMADNTLREFAFKVLPRPIPPNYVFTPTEQLTFEGLVQKETNKFNTNAIEKLNAYNANADNRVAEFNAQTEQIQADVSELKSDLSNYVGKYNGNILRYKSGNGAYNSSNEHIDVNGNTYFYADFELTDTIVLSGDNTTGIVLTLDSNKELISVLHNWGNVVDTYYPTENVAYLRVSIEKASASKVNVSSPNSNVNKVLSVFNEGNVEYTESVISEWEIGSLNDSSGNTTASTNRIRTIDKINIVPYSRLSISIESGYKYGLYFYDETTFLGIKDWSTKNNENILSLYPNATDIKIIVADTSNGTITDIDTYADKITIIATINKLNVITDNQNRLSALEEKVFDYEYKPPKMVTLIDDDGFCYFYSHLLPIIKEMNVPITSPNVARYAVEHVESEYGVMTWEQLEECALYGAEICSHSWNNIGGTKYPIFDEQGVQVMSDEEILYDFIKSRNTMKIHGVNSDCLVYPNASDAYEKIGEIAKLAGYKYCFTGGVPSVHQRGDFDPYMISRFGMDDKLLDFNLIKNVIDKYWGSKESGWMVLKIHTSFADWQNAEKRTIMVDNIKQMINYLRNMGVTFVTAEVATREYIV